MGFLLCIWKFQFFYVQEKTTLKNCLFYALNKGEKGGGGKNRKMLT